MSKKNGAAAAPVEEVEGDGPLTPKMEAFVQAYFETGNASEAYRRAYDAQNMKPESIHVRACELLKHSKVAVRVKEIRAKAFERSALTAQTILDELEQARLLALSLEQPAAMVAASLGRAKVGGLIVERRENGGPGDFAKMSDEELVEHAKALGKKLGVNSSKLN